VTERKKKTRRKKKEKETKTNLLPPMEDSVELVFREPLLRVLACREVCIFCLWWLRKRFGRDLAELLSQQIFETRLDHCWKLSLKIPLRRFRNLVVERPESDIPRGSELRRLGYKLHQRPIKVDELFYTDPLEEKALRIKRRHLFRYVGIKLQERIGRLERQQKECVRFFAYSERFKEEMRLQTGREPFDVWVFPKKGRELPGNVLKWTGKCVEMLCNYKRMEIFLANGYHKVLYTVQMKPDQFCLAMQRYTDCYCGFYFY
jgi:hypothetical protein